MMPKGKEKPIIIITGSEGTIGTALRSAFKKEYEVVGFDLKDTPCDISIDLSSDDSVTLAFHLFREKYKDKIAVVIHLAAYFDFTGKESPLYKEVNVNGTKRLLKVLQNFEVERFIFTSSMLVHKACVPGEKINEETPLEPKWIYPESKLKAEKVIEQYHGHIPYLILRLAGLYDNEVCVPTLSNQIARVYERDFKGHLYAGDIRAGQSFIHLDDLINLFKQAILLRNDLPKKDAILAGEPEAVSYEILQNIIGRLIHGEDEWKTLAVPALLAKTESWIEQKAEPIIPDDFDQGEKPFIRPFMIDLASDHYALNIKKAKKILKWEPKHNIVDTLPKIIQSLKKSPKTWYKKNDIKLPDWILATKNINPDKIRVENEKMIRQEHQQNLWAHFLNIAMGFWLITSPHTLGYQSQGLIWSDIISGAVIVCLGLLCLSWKFAMLRWACAGIGFWLLFAPLIFWAPTAAAYLNDTLVGSLIIGFSVLTRPDIGVAPNAAMIGSKIPPGWNYSPSSWFQRLPIIILAFIGLFISRYLTAYQLGHISNVWEPFFLGNPLDPKNGTAEIITSYVSKAWPIPDAGLGAVTYILEILTGIIGGANRWRTMPWLVLLFGFMIIPLGTVSITFIIIQPILLNTWCTLCLIAAASMLLQIPYSFDEIVASAVFLWKRYKAGRPILRILFVGDSDEINKKDKIEKNVDNFEQSPRVILKEMLTGGISIPWSLFICLLIGIWLMLARITLGTVGSLANVDHLIGSIVVTITITAFAEVMRPIRFLNLILAALLLIVTLVYEASMLDIVTNIILAMVLFIFSLPRGKIRDAYGVWNKFII